MATAHEASESLTASDISFRSGLLSFSVLILVSTVCDKIGMKLSIPGSIFLFIAGLFINISGFTFESIPLEQVHVAPLCVLLFFSGLTIDRSILRRSNLLFSSLRLAFLGTATSMLFWLFYVRLGLGAFSHFGYASSVQPKMLTLMSVVMVYSMAVHDWNSFSFVARKLKMLQAVVGDIFKLETSISAAISVAVAQWLVLAWVQFNPEYAFTNQLSLAAEIFNGILLGIVSGCILGYFLNLMVRYFVTSKPQLLLVAVGFTILGYVLSDLSMRHGGYLCALVMGVVTSLSYRTSSTEDEIEFLSEELESLNIACEAILFFVIGLGLDARSFISDLPVAFYLWFGIIIIRPICVWLFVRGDTIGNAERRLLSFWSPKGAVSMALVVQAPLLLKDIFDINMVELVPLEGYSLMANSVCGAVIISMIVKSLLVPRLHQRLSGSLTERLSS